MSSPHENASDARFLIKLTAALKPFSIVVLIAVIFCDTAIDDIPSIKPSIIAFIIVGICFASSTMMVGMAFIIPMKSSIAPFIKAGRLFKSVVIIVVIIFGNSLTKATIILGIACIRAISNLIAASISKGIAFITVLIMVSIIFGKASTSASIIVGSASTMDIKSCIPASSSSGKPSSKALQILSIITGSCSMIIGRADKMPFVSS